ncbi:MAG: hypothetical protein DRJ44_05675 [Thermoprotei archaeon]|nr:MAG: hypothetical protein DRJ44_05675 [Thermoprotei archaeon]
MSELVDFLMELVSIKTELRIEEQRVVRENYEKITNVIDSKLRDLDLKVEKIILEDEFGRVPAILAEPKDIEATESIALVSHYDVVPARSPWSINGREVDPYEPVLIEDKLFGRGSADDKSAIAASIFALKEALEENYKFRYKPVLVITGDEEGGPLGIKALLEKGYRWDKAAILDASADFLSVGASGIIHGWIYIYGKGGHAGYPHLADNPVAKLVKVMSYIQEEYGKVRLSKISRFPSPPGSPLPYVWGRFNFTIIKLGEGEVGKHNVIPREVIAGFDVRLIPEEDPEEAVKEFASYLSAAFNEYGVRGKVEVIARHRGWYTTDKELENKAFEALKKAIKAVNMKQDARIGAELGGNDGTFFYLKGIPVIAFGAIRSNNNIHADNEFVYLRDVEFLKEYVKALIAEGS